MANTIARGTKEQFSAVYVVVILLPGRNVDGAKKKSIEISISR